MDVGAALLFPFQWLVSAVLVGFHDVLGTAGMPPASGWTWTLSVIGLVLAIRAALIPAALAQGKAQRHIMARNMAAGTGPAARQQRVLLYALPAVFGAGGILFPVGVLIYWTTTNLWTMVQQFILAPGP